MDTRLAECFFQPPGRVDRVLGRRLRPFCLWHSLQLSAFEGVQAPTAYTQLALAADVCRLRAGEVYRAPRGIRRRIERVRALCYARRPGALLEQIEAFADYRRAWSSGPRFWTRSGSVACKTPWQLLLAARLVRLSGRSWVAAWETPLGRALWLATALAEASGTPVSLMTEADEAALRAAGFDPDQL